jgi:hypothetical protein
MEIIQVDLAPGLELVEEIKERKCEGGTRARPRGRKPAGTKKLNTAVARWYTVGVTEAVGDPHGMRP